MVATTPWPEDGISLLCTWIHKIHADFLVHGPETSLLLDLMFPSPETEFSSSFLDFVHRTEQAFQRAFELIRRNLNKNERQRNAIKNHKVHDCRYKDGQEVPLRTPVIPVGQSPHFFSQSRGPHTTVKCLNDVNYQIKSQHRNRIRGTLRRFETVPKEASDDERPNRGSLRKLRLRLLMYKPEVKRLHLPLLKMISIIVTAPSGHLYQHLNTFRLPLQCLPQEATSHHHVLHLR